MKKIVLALAFVLLGSFMLSDCSKDEILDHYNNIVQSAGAIELTGKSSLEGTKEKGIDDYTASDFHSAFRKSKTPFPRHWEELFVRYSKADSKQQTEFEKRLLNGEYIEKWTE